MTCTHDCNQGRECRCTDVSGWSKRPESFNREYLEPADQGTVIAILVACGVCACFTLIGVVTFVRWIV